MRTSFVFVLSVLCLPACGQRENEQASPLTPVGEPESLSLATLKNVYCPSGTTFLASHQLCASSTEAVGPFPGSMVESCRKFGGGEACTNGRWDLSLAKSIRGTALCPPGTTFDKSVEECTDGTYAYGPFSTETVQYCKQKGGGDSCETLRIAKSQVPKVAVEPNLAVPYFFQYNNAYEPGRTCNLTSLAMVMNYYGKSYTPDTLYANEGGPVFSGSTLAAIARDYGFNATYSEQGSKEIIKKHLQEGRPVILQGWFTPVGHFVVLVGYNKDGWIVNDPAGRWNQLAYGGYSGSSTSGKKIVYGYGAIEEAATDPGNPNSYWITILSKK